MQKLLMIFCITVMLILALVWFVFAEEYTVNEIADAIRVAEGVNSRYPYGVKSIDTKGDADYARKICVQSIVNNIKRWEKSGRPKPFLEFMADRWCPKAADFKGHSVWAKNVRAILAKNRGAK